MHWIIYYGDRSTFSSKDGDPFHAPAVNVQVVVTDGALQFSKENYYWNDDFGWQGCDIYGLHDYFYTYKGPKAMLFGRSIRDEDFWAIVKRATDERDAAKVG